MIKAKQLILPAVVAVAGFVGVSGATMVSRLSAYAATPAATSTSNTSSTADPTDAPDTTQESIPAHGSASHVSTEAAVTGDNAAKAQAAAVKSLGGGTASSVVNDFRKSGYEVTVMKTDGTSTEVHLDSTFTVEDHGSHGGN